MKCIKLYESFDDDFSSFLLKIRTGRATPEENERYKIISNLSKSEKERIESAYDEIKYIIEDDYQTMFSPESDIPFLNIYYKKIEDEIKDKTEYEPKWNEKELRFGHDINEVDEFIDRLQDALPGFTLEKDNLPHCIQVQFVKQI